MSMRLPPVISALHALAIHKVMLAPDGNSVFRLLSERGYATRERTKSRCHLYRITTLGIKVDETNERAGLFRTKNCL